MTPQELAAFIAEQERKQRLYMARRVAWRELHGLPVPGRRG